MLPFALLAYRGFGDDRLERFGQPWPQMLIFRDLQTGEERLVREPAVGVVGARVGVVGVGQQAQRIVQECPRRAGVLVL